MAKKECFMQSLGASPQGLVLFPISWQIKVCYFPDYHKTCLVDSFVHNCCSFFLSYTVRSGHDVVSASNLDSNDMAGVHNAGFRKALRQVLENTMNTNVKVQVNQAIQAMS